MLKILSMEQIKQAASEIIGQMLDLAGKLSQVEFTRPLPILMDHSIGKHYRHIIEFFGVMLAGAQEGVINYDSRNHDPALEQDRNKCIEKLAEIRQNIDLEPAGGLNLRGSYAAASEKNFSLPTSFERELVYNIEHAIHHLAIIRIALQHEFKHIQVGHAFGYAYSTLKHKEH
jgi:hypothetical protein